MNSLKIFKNKEALTKATAQFIISESNKCIKERGSFTWALSGGSTPLNLYKLLATDSYQKKIDWKNIYIFWSDERYVPFQSEENNSHQAKIALLDNIDIPQENIFTIPVNLPVKKAARHYEQTLQQFFKTEIPAFDLILLGMGSNGHTASLFPNTEILKEKEALVKSCFIDEVNMDRISFTVPLINHAKKILFLISGAEKAETLKIVLGNKKQPQLYPAQLIKASKKNELIWFVDSKAASTLPAGFVDQYNK